MAKAKSVNEKVTDITPITPVRLIPSDKEAVERIKARFNLSTTADAIRMAIHFLDGVPIVGAKKLAEEARKKF